MPGKSSSEISEDLHSIIAKHKSNRTNLPDIDFTGFSEFYTGKHAEGTIVHYMSYLAQTDFDLTDEDMLQRYDRWARQEAEEKFGAAAEDKPSRQRFIYMTCQAIKKYLTYQDRQELIEKLPEGKDLEKPISKRQTVRYTEEQIQKVIEAADSEHDKLAIILMFYSGLRIYEVLHITPEWLEFRDDYIEISIPPKYAKGRRDGDPNKETAILKTEFSDRLKEYIKQRYEFDGEYNDLYATLVDRDSDREFEPLFMFTDSDKSFHDLANERYHANQMLKQAAKKAGINQAGDISCHKLRKSFIHRVYDATQDLNRARHLARHKDPSTTADFYLQIDKEEKIGAYQDVFGQEDNY